MIIILTLALLPSVGSVVPRDPCHTKGLGALVAAYVAAIPPLPLGEPAQSPPGGYDAVPYRRKAPRIFWAKTCPP
jgi:hypothetical protein